MSCEAQAITRVAHSASKAMRSGNHGFKRPIEMCPVRAPPVRPVPILGLSRVCRFSGRSAIHRSWAARTCTRNPSSSNSLRRCAHLPPLFHITDGSHPSRRNLSPRRRNTWTVYKDFGRASAGKILASMDPVTHAGHAPLSHRGLKNESGTAYIYNSCFLSAAKSSTRAATSGTVKKSSMPTD